jgi:hypothetical protein
MSAKLWEIGDELELIGALIAEAGGEVTPDVEERLEKLEGAFGQKVERIALYIASSNAYAEAAKREEDRLAFIRKSHERTADGLKRYLLATMRRTGYPKVETPRVRVRVQKNGQPSISWPGSLESLPEQYRRVTVAPDLARVREDLSAGAEPPDGFVIDYGYHIRIS